jgi:zinc transport system substrate-binding protein
VPNRGRARWVAAAALAAPISALVGACASPALPADGTTTVVASFYPLAEAARQVGGAAVAVDNLTPPGVEPHDLELSPKEIEAIATADVVLYLGQGFQPAVEDAVGVATGVRVDLLQGMPVRSGSDEGPGGSVTDPHVWLDPTLMSRIVGRVEAALAKAGPANADAFAANARAYRTELAGLDEEFRAGLSSCRRDLLVTSHAAFGYLADRYGLRQEAISGLSPEAEPDPRRLAELAELVRANGATTIFTEELVSPAVADALARETGVTTEVLNPLESLSLPETASGDDYVSVMRRNLAALRRGLGCATGA